MSLQQRQLGHVLVTGGCGFLGSHIVELLLERSITSKVSVIDLRTTQNRQDKANYYDVDITDSDRVKSLFETLKPDVVIHTASPVFNANKPDLMYKVNVEGTKTLVKVSQESNVKAFVYTSSASIIGDQKNDLVYADERWTVLPKHMQPEYYSATKAEAEAHVLSSNRQPSSTFLTCAIRPAGLFGPRDVQLLPPILNVLVSGRTHFQIGANTNLFDFTYVANAAHAHLLAAAALLATPRGSQATVPLDTERVDGEAFIVTNDAPVYFWDFTRAAWRAAAARRGLSPPAEVSGVWELSREVAMGLGAVMEAVFRVLGRKPSLTRQQARYSCQARYFCVEKAKRRLGYRPIVGLEEGLRKGADDWAKRKEALENPPRLAEKSGL